MGTMNWTVGTHTRTHYQKLDTKQHKTKPNQTKQRWQRQQRFDQANKYGKCMCSTKWEQWQNRSDGESSRWPADWLTEWLLSVTTNNGFVNVNDYHLYLFSARQWSSASASASASVSLCVWFAHHWPPYFVQTWTIRSFVWLFNFICGFVCTVCHQLLPTKYVSDH